MTLWARLSCWLGNHSYHVIGRPREYIDHVRCIRCHHELAINHKDHVALPWAAVGWLHREHGYREPIA